MSREQMQAMPASNQVVVKFREGNRVRFNGGQLSGISGPQAAVFENLLREIGIAGTAIRRLHNRPEAELDAERDLAQRRSGRELADLNHYYVLNLPQGVNAAEVANRLNALDFVEFAEPAPRPAPPPFDISPPTPDFTSFQGYRNPVPQGIGVPDPSAFPGTDGAGVSFADVEYSWQLDHEDLELPSNRIVNVGSTPSDPFNDTDHGTAVLGAIVGERNIYGVTGIAPAAVALLAPANTILGYNPAGAISAATGRLSAGDVIVIEQQYSVCGTSNYGPLEVLQPVYDAVSTATALGIIVVAAAGNGNVNLDAASCGGLFNRSVRDSGAIIVGAGASSDHSRLSFSSYGSRVDVQGWGENVTTTGYGYAFNPDDIRQRYTNSFGGTSSATPIVSGAVLSIQGRLKTCGRPVATPASMRQMLVTNGTPQGTATSGHIGPLPRIPDALAALGVAGNCTAPSNDNFANAIVLSGSATAGFTSGSNVSATKEAGEPNHADNTGGKSVWWQWTPTSSGQVTFTTATSSFDTLLAVYTGGSVSGLTLIKANDDVNYPIDLTSSVTFTAVAGTTYRIVVDGYNGGGGAASGSISLNWSQTTPPPTCTLTASPTSIPQGQSATLTWTSQNATSASITNIGSVPTSGTQNVSPSQTTTYTGTFTGAGGSIFCNTTITVITLLNLQVSPATAISASGTQGGPFSPSSLQYQLSASSGSIGYTITGLPSWLTASATSGTATTSATTVTFSVNSNANALAVGSYGPVTITFTNTTSGQGNTTRTATLTVNATGWGGTPSRRTFVSANGNDGNNCSRPAPCRTFQTAHDRTTAKGEINVLDSVDYGAVTITKAISIVNDGVGSAGVLVPAGGTGITISAGSTDIINLRGLVIEGAGIEQGGQNGIVFNSGMSLNIQNCVVRNLFDFGIDFRPNASSSLFISKTFIADNGFFGIYIEPTGSGTVTAAFNNIAVDNNNSAGIAIYGTSSTGIVEVTLEESSIAGNGNSGSTGGVGVYVQSSVGAAATTVMVRRSDLINTHGYGAQANGAATLRLTRSTITGNLVGWSTINGGTLLSYGDNNIDGNTNDGGNPPVILDK
jgi:hypothetical protein